MWNDRHFSQGEDLARDVAYGLRALRRDRAFTLTAVVTLAMTLGTVATVFTFANTLFFEPIPVDQPGQVVNVTSTRGSDTDLGFVSYPDYAHFRERTRTLEDLAAHYSTAPLFVTTDTRAEEVNAAVVSSNYFSVLRLEPAVGRFFGPGEDSVPDRDPVAVLSHALWENWFDSASDVVGTVLTLNGSAFTVVGVAPRGFRGLADSPNEIYIPTMMLRVGYRWCDDSLAAHCTTLSMIGRLDDGRTVEQAKAELATLVPERWRASNEPGKNSGVTVFGTRGMDQPGAELRLITLLSLVAGVVLAVCCANLAGLLIARGSARTRELAIRTSLGATRTRLTRQLLTESLLLALGGGLLGVGLSLGLARLLNTMFYSFDSAGRPLHFDFSLDPVVAVVALAVSALAGIVFGLVPAVQSVRGGVAEGMKGGSSRVSAPTGLGRWLVGAQAAAAMALVIVATLLWASASLLVNGANFDPSRVALLRLRPNLLAYPPEKAQPFLREVVHRLEALPAVESVSMVGTGGALGGFEADVSLPEWAGSQTPPVRAGYIEIGPGYFETLSTPLVRGREFDERDTAGSVPVAIVSEALVRRLWPEGNAVGATVGVGEYWEPDAPVATHRPHRVIGVVADVGLQNRAESLKPYVFLPFWQNPELIDARLQVRVASDPAVMLPLLIAEVRGINPEVPVSDTVTLPFKMAGSFRPVIMSAAFVSYASTLAVVLSAIGLYGALSFAVSRRNQEIGIRMALGAGARKVLLMIIGEGMRVILVGAAAGLLLAIGSVRLLAHYLYGSAAGDPIAYALAGMLVATVSFIACWLPARRASGVSPVTALRSD